MWIQAFFTDLGSPALGLTPTLRIRDLDTNALIITDESMIEVGDGFYKYDFASFDKLKDYSIRCDGGSALEDSERYVYAGNTSNVKEISDSVWDVTLDDHTSADSTGEALNDIKNGTATIYGGFGS